MEDCIFCKIINKQIPSNIIYENKHTIAFLDISKDAYGHTLVIPKKHCTNILDCDKKTLKEVFKTVKKISKHYVENKSFSGVNILNASGKDAQQTVFHFHVHIIPRKQNDGLNCWPNLKESEMDLAKIAEQLKLSN